MIERVQSVSKLSIIAEAYLTGIVKAGPGEFKALCPFHDEDTPSFCFNDTVYHCFGCGEKGNVFTFIMKVEGVTFSQALRYLAQKAGIEFTITDKEANAVHARSELRDKIYRAALAFWTQNQEKAIQYLATRGLKEDLAFEFNVVYSDSQSAVVHALTDQGFSVRELQEFRIVNKANHDFFFRRVIIPVHWGGQIVNLYGRSVDSESEVRHVFSGENTVPFNLDRVRMEDTLYGVEGLLDALSLVQEGYPSISFQGTHGLKAAYLSLFRPETKFVLVPDHDLPNKKGERPGFVAAEDQAHTLANAGHPVMIKLLPEGEDPNSALQKGISYKDCPNVSPIQFAPKSSVSFIRPIGQDLSLSIDTSHELKAENVEWSPKGIRATVSWVHKDTIKHRDNLSLWSATRRKSFAKEVREKADQLLILFEQQILLFLEEQKKKRQEEERHKGEISPEDQEEAMAFLKSEGLLKSVPAHLEVLGYTGETINKLMVYLIATSRKLANPLSAIISSQSASGKSALVHSVIQLMPPEEIKEITRMTRNALFYLPPDALQHKFVVMAERAGAEEADYSIRTMQSEQKLVIETVMKDTKGVLQTITKEVLGPMAYIETTTMTQTELNAENLTRCFLLTMNESVDQTEKIHRIQRDKRLLSSISTDIEAISITRLHQNTQRLLKPYHVVIPYAHYLTFPTDQVRCRRDHDRFLQLIQVIAYLHQYQRKNGVYEGVPFLEASVEDYEYAYHISFQILRQTLDDLPQKSRELLISIRSMLQDQVKEIKSEEPIQVEDVYFTKREVREYCGWPDAQVYRYMKPLEYREYILQEQSRTGKSFRYRFNATEMDTMFPTIRGMLSPKELRQKIAEEVMKGVSDARV